MSNPTPLPQQSGTAPANGASREPRVSGIVATKGRSEEIRPLLESFRRQTRPIDEIVVVDQNEDDRMAKVLAEYPDLPIHHIHNPDLRGLNKSRNHGWRACTGQLVFFPDDDCYYEDNFLQLALDTMSRTSANVVAGRCPEGRGGRFEAVEQWIDRHNVWSTQVEWIVVFERAALEMTGGYDENLGVGADTFWGAGEAQELALKIMACGFRAYYNPDLIAHHPPLDLSQMDAANIQRFSSYSTGMGYVLVRHGYPLGYSIYLISRALGTIAKAALKGQRAKALVGWCVFKNRLHGYLRARREIERYRPPSD